VKKAKLKNIKYKTLNFEVFIPFPPWGKGLGIGGETKKPKFNLIYLLSVKSFNTPFKSNNSLLKPF
jgi:hypothetical protein